MASDWVTKGPAFGLAQGPCQTGADIAIMAVLTYHPPKSWTQEMGQ